MNAPLPYRTSPNDGPRPRLTRLAAGGAFFVALLMLLSPAATAATTNLVLHPRYHGSVAPYDDYAVSACGTASSTKAWQFDLKTGVARAASTGRASACRHHLTVPGQTSSSADYGGLTASIALPHLAAATTNISVQVSAKWVATISASDGRSTACNAPLTSFVYSDLDWGWNYTSSGGFGGSAYEYNYSSSGPAGNYSTNASANLSTVPLPFNLNASTYLLIDYWTGATGSCDSYAYTYFGTYGYLDDLSTGTTIPESGDSASTLFEAVVSVYNQTDYECGTYFYWNGPAAVTYGNTTTNCYSYNTTLSSYVYVWSPTPYYASGANNVQGWGGPGSATGSIWFNGPFQAHDRYVLDLSLYAGAYVSTSWPKGFATWDLNLAAGGGGFKVSSIAIT